MKVFVTGASGFVGSAVVQELLRAGHEVTGLVRSEESAEVLRVIGARPIFGDLNNLESLRKGASESDGVIHTAFIHDFSRFKENCEVDQRAIELFGEVLSGTNRPLVVTSGFADIDNHGEIINEAHDISTDQIMTPRQSEQAALKLVKEKNINARIVRLAPAVHGDGPYGFMAGFATVLMTYARSTGVSAYVEDGSNIWHGIHRLDAASLFTLAFLKGEKGGRYHGVETKGVTFRSIAEAIGKKINVPVQSITEEEAAKHFTWLKNFVVADFSSSNELTREKLGWNPVQVGLVEDIERAVLPVVSKY